MTDSDDIILISALEAEIDRLRGIMEDQRLELTGAGIDLQDSGADKVCIDTIRRAVQALGATRK